MWLTLKTLTYLMFWGEDWFERILGMLTLIMLTLAVVSLFSRAVSIWAFVLTTSLFLFILLGGLIYRLVGIACGGIRR